MLPQFGPLEAAEVDTLGKARNGLRHIAGSQHSRGETDGNIRVTSARKGNYFNGRSIPCPYLFSPKTKVFRTNTADGSNGAPAIATHSLRLQERKAGKGLCAVPPRPKRRGFPRILMIKTFARPGNTVYTQDNYTPEV